ncbi:MAG: carboxylesterase family protein [Pseudomonadota bacterium]
MLLRSLLFPALLLLLLACDDIAVGSRDTGAGDALLVDAGPADTAMLDAADAHAAGDASSGADAGDAASEDATSSVPFQTGTEVSTSLGSLRGREDGDDLRVFRGIPYARPPIGELRLRAPQPAEPWDGVREVDDYGPSCPQAMLTFNATDEDCLSLNVWAHQDSIPRPVMVWIYGGGFMIGETAMLAYDAADLARDADVVVVTLNYRLGALGYLAIPELQAEDPSGAVGTLGLLDQIEALRWVRANAPAFGGDPDNITVFGESAGAMSTCALIGAPLADGLFHKAIVQSGSCALFPVLDGDSPLGPSAFDSGERIMQNLGCAEASDRLACLRALPVEDLAQAIDSMALMSVLHTEVAIGPAVDGVVLPQLPYARIVSGDAPARPMIVGSNGNEAPLFTSTEVILTYLDFENALAELFGDADLAAEVVALYSVLEYPVAKDAFDAFVGEILFNCNSYHAAQSLDGLGYAYHLENGPGALMSVHGPLHGSDIFYVFGNFTSSGLVPSLLDLDLSARMQQAWGSFARTGVPNWEGGWPALQGEDPQHLAIGLFTDLDGNFRGGHCDALQTLGVLP